MTRKLSYWIKERHNPQMKNPYYSACGKLPLKQAREKENSLYGYNFMLQFHSEEEYKAKIAELKLSGNTVHGE